MIKVPVIRGCHNQGSLQSGNRYYLSRRQKIFDGLQAVVGGLSHALRNVLKHLRSKQTCVCVCVTGLQRSEIQDPSSPKALFTRVLKVPTQALSHLVLPPNLPTSAVKAVPKHQTPAEMFTAWLLSFLTQVLLTGPPKKILPSKPWSLSSPLRTKCAPPIPGVLRLVMKMRSPPKGV